jgi:hypothetical protein
VAVRERGTHGDLPAGIAEVQIVEPGTGGIS